MSVLKDIFRKKEKASVLPLLYTPDSVLFPDTVLSLSVTSKFCMNALQEAFHKDRLIAVVLLKKLPETGDTELEFRDVGTVARILQITPGIDGSQRLLLEGKERVRFERIRMTADYYSADFKLLVNDQAPLTDTKELFTLVAIAKSEFKHYAEHLKKIPFETLQAVERTDNAEALCNIIGHFMPINQEKKQELLSLGDICKRVEYVIRILSEENELVEIQQKIEQKVKTKISKAQKDYFLQEKLREIKKELGRDTETANEFEELEKQILAKNPPEETAHRIRKEIRKLAKLPPLSPEAAVLRTYLEWFGELPWQATNPENDLDMACAKAILDRDHYGMEKVKERILEFIAVQKISSALRGPILCFVGPPGTGKTSLGKSIARALNRGFVRISLGGLRDEAEIRGHRRTYVGALPGKIIQGMKRVDSINPVFLLDEIDKMSSDFRGDPASALLEVLDPEQNFNFTDHYLEVPYNLSSVVFITTANSLSGIPYPLLDRMEIIEIPGYTDFEKLAIARQFIIPKQLKENGLEKLHVKWTDSALKKLIHDYTMESGVRSLEREIAHVIRKLALDIVEKGKLSEIEKLKKEITEKEIEKFLGKKKFDPDLVFSDIIPGLVYGLAWTELGGSILPIEVTCFAGENELILTGNLGDVMKESARTALTYIRAHMNELGIKKTVFENKTIHIHVPEGAIPKDGPSAGITLASAMLSSFLGIPVEQGWAMTGEITLTGRIVPVGGVKEKVLAAFRNKSDKLLLPEKNRKDLDEIPREVLDAMDVHCVSTVLEAFSILFPLKSALSASSGKKSARKKQ